MLPPPGYYVYTWENTKPDDDKLLYVGRTGDSSSPNPPSLFTRLGRNLGTIPTSSMVGNNLAKRGIDPDQCQYRIVGYGPIFEEPAVKNMEDHKPLRDKTGAAEKQLALDLTAAGYDVINEVRCNAPLDKEVYAPVRAAFAAEFPALAGNDGAGGTSAPGG
jgi:hypothetical protein